MLFDAGGDRVLIDQGWETSEAFPIALSVVSPPSGDPRCFRTTVLGLR